MKTFSRLFLIVMAVGSLGAGPSPKGLELKLELADPKQPAFKLSLVNAGPSARKVIKPGDGSDVGWREPAIRWTGQVQQEGKWVDIPLRAVGRCGVYESNWHRDVVDLNPGQKLAIEWGTYPVTLVLPEHGRIRLVATYEYAGGTHRKGGKGPLDPGPMGSVAPFTVTSEPLEFVR